MPTSRLQQTRQPPSRCNAQAGERSDNRFHMDVDFHTKLKNPSSQAANQLGPRDNGGVCLSPKREGFLHSWLGYGVDKQV